MVQVKLFDIFVWVTFMLLVAINYLCIIGVTVLGSQYGLTRSPMAIETMILLNLFSSIYISYRWVSGHLYQNYLDTLVIFLQYTALTSVIFSIIYFVECPKWNQGESYFNARYVCTSHWLVSNYDL
jgi:hypothetical protein